MTDELRVHWVLHETDEQSVAREQQLARHPELRRAHAAKVAAARAALASLDQRIAEARQRRRALEQDIAGHDVQHRRFEQQLQAVTDQKQYEAVQHELAAVHAKRDALETEALEWLEREEHDVAGRVDKAHVLERAEAESAAAGAALDAEGERLQQELAQLDAQRREAAARLPAASRTRYEKLRAGRAGRAVAVIENHACGACHRGLPPAGLQAARRRETLLVCDGCGRLLMLAPEEAAGA